MCIYMHIYMIQLQKCSDMCMNIYINVYIHMNIFTYISICVPKHILKCMHNLIYLRVCIIYIYMYIYIYMDIHTYMYMRDIICVYIYIWVIHAYMYTLSYGQMVANEQQKLNAYLLVCIYMYIYTGIYLCTYTSYTYLHIWAPDVDASCKCIHTWYSYVRYAYILWMHLYDASASGAHICKYVYDIIAYIWMCVFIRHSVHMNTHIYAH